MRREVIGDRFPFAQQTIRGVIALTETVTIGIQFVRVSTVASRATPLVSGLARELRLLGFVMLRANTTLSPPLRDHLCHRHLAVHFGCGEPRAPVVRWIRSLARVSPRAHLVIEFDDSKRAGRPIVEFAGWEEQIATALCRVHALLDTGGLEQAEALLASLDVEAAVRRVRVPERVSLAWARLRTRQGRTEEARRRLNGAPVTGHFRELEDASAARHSHLAATGSRR